MLAGMGTRVLTGGMGYMPGEACYDPTKPSWLPNTSTPDDFYELGCYLNVELGLPTGSPATTTLTYNAPAPAADTGTTSAGDVNDPNGTNAAITAGNPTDAQLQAAAVAAARASVTGLTDGGCLKGQTGTYPNCKDAAGNWTPMIIALGVGLVALVALKGK